MHSVFCAKTRQRTDLRNFPCTTWNQPKNGLPVKSNSSKGDIGWFGREFFKLCFLPRVRFWRAIQSIEHCRITIRFFFFQYRSRFFCLKAFETLGNWRLFFFCIFVVEECSPQFIFSLFFFWKYNNNQKQNEEFVTFLYEKFVTYLLCFITSQTKKREFVLPSITS